MANAEMKIFEAEKLHQPMIAAVSIIPIMPLKRRRRRRRRQEVSFDIHAVMWNVRIFVKPETKSSSPTNKYHTLAKFIQQAAIILKSFYK